MQASVSPVLYFNSRIWPPVPIWRLTSLVYISLTSVAAVGAINSDQKGGKFGRGVLYLAPWARAASGAWVVHGSHDNSSICARVSRNTPSPGTRASPRQVNRRSAASGKTRVVSLSTLFSPRRPATWGCGWQKSPIATPAVGNLSSLLLQLWSGIFLARSCPSFLFRGVSTCCSVF